MQAWQTRSLDEIYAAVFTDAILVKVRDGQVANRPIYAAIGVTLEGEPDILGLWSSSGGEGAGETVTHGQLPCWGLEAWRQLFAISVSSGFVRAGRTKTTTTAAARQANDATRDAGRNRR